MAMIEQGTEGRVVSLAKLAAAVMVVTYIGVTSWMVYTTRYELAKLRREAETRDSNREAFIAAARRRIELLEEVIFVQVIPDVAAAQRPTGRTAANSPGAQQAWQRNLFANFERRIVALERWRYTCRCGGETMPFMSNLFVPPLEPLGGKCP